MAESKMESGPAVCFIAERKRTSGSSRSDRFKSGDEVPRQCAASLPLACLYPRSIIARPDASDRVSVTLVFIAADAWQTLLFAPSRDSERHPVTKTGRKRAGRHLSIYFTELFNLICGA